MGFIDELKRRKVFRVGIAYAITAWVVLQVADIATESFAAPDWVMRTLFTLLVLGFFASLVLAWAFQFTAKGLQRDRGEVAEGVATAERGVPGRWQAVVFVVLVGVIAWLLFDRFQVDGPDAPAAHRVAGSASVAVLPFVNMSMSEENEYFSDGLTDTLLHKLAQVKDLKVAARTSSFAYKDTNTDIREIAGTLGVGNVLEGSVQRAGNTVRITAQLIQADDGYHLWSGTYDRDLDDIFAVQDEIAAQVASALTGSLLEQSASETRNDGGTENSDAYDLYLRGREAYRENTERRLSDSMRMLRQAVTLDPEFALAWAALAESIMAHATLAGLSYRDYEVEVFAAANRAVELAPDNSITVGVKGYVLFEFGQNSDGRDLLERALELDPNNVWALSRLADAQFGDAEFLTAVDSARRAMAMDPLDYALKANSTFKFLQIGRVDDARALAQAVLDQDPESFEGLAALANTYWRTGDHSEAFRLYHRLLQAHPNTYYVYGRIAQSFGSLGDFEAAQAWSERAAEINPGRGKARMAWLCWYEGNLECARSRMREIIQDLDQDNPQEREWLAAWTADLAWIDQDWERAMEAYQAELSMVDDRGAAFRASHIHVRTAYLAERLNDLALRDELLSVAEAENAKRFANGSDSQYTYWIKAELHALRGEPGSTSESLRSAIALGFRGVVEVDRNPYYDKVRSAPEMQALIADLKVIAAQELEELKAAEKELLSG